MHGDITDIQPLPPTLLVMEAGEDRPLLQEYYKPKKALVGVDTPTVLCLLAALCEPAPALFISTGMTATGKSFFSFILRLFGRSVFTKRSSGTESGFWMSLSRAVKKLDDQEKR